MNNNDVALEYEAYTERLYEQYIKGEPKEVDEDECNNTWEEENDRL